MSDNASPKRSQNPSRIGKTVGKEAQAANKFQTSL